MKAGLSPSKKVYSNDFVMARVDKSVGDLFAEKPSSRWDAGYWEPKWDSLNKEISLPLVDFSQLIEEKGITYGQVGQRIFSKTGSVRYLQVINLRPTGIDFYVKDDKVEEDTHSDPKRSRLKPGQVLLSRTSFPGMDTLIGRCIVVPKSVGKANVSEDIDVITLKKGVSPEAVCVFLKTKYGQDQIHRKKKGVKSIKINFNDIYTFKIPTFPDPVQSHIEAEYKKMAAFHDKAMEAKAKGDDAACKKNIETADAMLKDLIARTEAVIKGEREDVG